jgi:cyclic pyranopterin phosphate synthase
MELSHVDEAGRARMVDVSHKEISRREALAEGRVFVSAETVRLIEENEVRKGDVLTVSEMAGVMGGKQTGTLIPLAHPVAADLIDVSCFIERNAVRITARARCRGRTGVEMEALTAVSVAALTVYDMCKAVDKEMSIGEIRLVEKRKDPLGEGERAQR